jgi:hypothetical protein
MPNRMEPAVIRTVLQALSGRCATERGAASQLSTGGRSEPGDSGRSRKSVGAIPRREFGPRDPGGSSQHRRCMPRWQASKWVLLAAEAPGRERRPISRRAEPAAGRELAGGCWISLGSNTPGSRFPRGIRRSRIHEAVLSGQRSPLGPFVPFVFFVVE